MEIEPGGALEMARRSRGTPRLANRILKRVRDFAQVKYEGIITEEVARTALDLMDVDFPTPSILLLVSVFPFP